MTGAYYNEIDPKAAAWLRELINQGQIAPGEVDERDIRDVCPADLHGFAQCHFFAGIGVWSYSLRRAGWPDDRPVWTGSCPCQPFSAAGKGAGFDDERHLWPAFFWLISQCRPAIVYGEQVASKDAEPWIDLVQDDLEAVGYGVGAVPFPSAGVGAPHIRDRLYWVADANSGQCDGQPIIRGSERNRQDSGRSEGGGELGACGDDEQLAAELDAWLISGDQRPFAEWLADTAASRHSEARQHERGPSQLPARPAEHGRMDRVREPGRGLSDGTGDQREHGLREVAVRPGPTNGRWGNADWIYCRNGEWRPVEPGAFPLAHGAPARVGRLRGYGNAINAEAAVAFIQASGGLA